MKIPFCKTTIGEEEKKAICDVIDSGWVVLGAKSQEFEEKFAEYVGAKHAVFVDSGTSALFIALQYLIKHKKLSDNYRFEVPSLTFTATAEAVINSGLTLEFGDVNYHTLCLETPHLDSLPVHLTGNRARDGALIYDSAHRIEKDDLRGNKEALWCYSFYATKNLTTVQGGMIVTNNKHAYEWLKMARDHGLDMGTKERYTGKYKQYDVKFVGYRVKGDDVKAAIGLAQLKKLPEMQRKRNDIVAKYNEAFNAKQIGNHVYPIFVNDRDKFMNEMIDAGIQCTIHFRPLHQMTGYQRYYDKRYSKELSNTDYIGEHIVSIPLFPDLTEMEQDYIIHQVNKTKLRI